MEWKKMLYFKQFEQELEFYLHADDNKYKYMNFNPQNKAGQGDQIFHIIKKLKPNISDDEILNIIINEKIQRGIMRLDSSSYKRIIKQIFKVLPQKPDLGISAIDFKIDSENEWVIIRMGKQVELFNNKEGKFYSCHAINKNKKISEYWII